MIFLTFRAVILGTFLFLIGFAMVAKPAMGAVHRSGDRVAPKPRTTLNLLNASSIGDLNAVVKYEVERERKIRACRIQQRQSLPPTMCYGLSQRAVDLDTDCLKFSFSVERIPAFDEMTSEVCRSALEKRKIDLAYARP